MLSHIQEKLLLMLEWFHCYCAENSISYYIAGGTMIGAMRHSGFIPWDDDIDVVIPRPEYNRLIEMMDNKPINGYLFESPYTGNSDYLFPYSKLYDTSTTLIEKSHIVCKRGLYIDIFPLDGLGDEFTLAKKNFTAYDKKHMFLKTRSCSIRKERSFYKNASIIVSRMIPGFLFNDKKYSIQIDEIAQKIAPYESTYVANLMGTYRFKEIVKHTLFGKPTLYKFENIEVFGPEKYDDYLSSIYGNWRELPPEEKRKTTHDYIELNLEKAYLDK